MLLAGNTSHYIFDATVDKPASERQAGIGAAGRLRPFYYLLSMADGRVRVARVILLRGVCPPNVTFHPLSDPSPFELAALQSGKGRASIGFGDSQLSHKIPAVPWAFVPLRSVDTAAR